MEFEEVAGWKITEYKQADIIWKQSVIKVSRLMCSDDFISQHIAIFTPLT